MWLCTHTSRAYCPARTDRATCSLKVVEAYTIYLNNIKWVHVGALTVTVPMCGMVVGMV